MKSTRDSIGKSLLPLFLAVLLPLELAAETYHIDSAAGDDLAAGNSIDTAWRTLKKVNATTFMPGDRILFKAGGAWSGQLHPKGSGNLDKPIMIDRYGEGPRPIIAGQGATELPGRAAVYLYNQEYFEIANLEITNYLEGDSGAKCGIYVLAEDFGAVHHIHLRNLFVHDVNGNLKTKYNGGVFLEVVGSKKKTWFDDLLIEGCHIRDVDRTGISNQSEWRFRSLEDDGNWVPNKHVVIRNNIVERAGQNGLIVRCTDSPLIEHNLFKDNGGKGTGNAMFTYNCDNALVQFNESYGTKFAPGQIDGAGFDSDYQCKNSVFQYNYSHDNDHGFILVCCQGRTTDFNDGTVVRYNISQNDGGNVFRISGKVTNTSIYNNVLYQGPKRETRVIWHKEWDDAWPDGTAYFNNIFYNLGSGGYDFGISKDNRFESNIFYGNHPDSEPEDPHKLTSDPLLVAPGEGKVGRDSLAGYQLKKGSPAIDSGQKISDMPPVDFWGNPLHRSRVPDRGAFEYEVEQ
ncbi:right-handed parallel beta-helix repeat-containing protein [Adhaeretor mobilis]|uniref:Right handed beta helix domain-containing protein n=1 Tax=Adhaeretor mobilis TaxID=1930276 RepID=A0A517MWE6_9BACT|nr:right-handed parallel beta-helix repeat-containing protein [Adhaeretor mobilis]QDS99205.1 hypothetical protein HG15A2_24970 [Adhaeretor mobilis]